MLRIYWHSLFVRPSGGSIFRCTTKDRGERRAKGLQSRPLDSGFSYGGMRGDVLAPYEFAQMQFTRFRPGCGVREAYCFHSLMLTAQTTPKTCRQYVYHRSAPQEDFLRRCFASPVRAQDAEHMEAVRRAHAMRDLIASHAPLRKGLHKARQASSKTFPRGSNGGRSPLGLSFSPIFLQTKKDGATGGRRISRAVSKNEKRKTKREKKPAVNSSQLALFLCFSNEPSQPGIGAPSEGLIQSAPLIHNANHRRLPASWRLEIQGKHMMPDDIRLQRR